MKSKYLIYFLKNLHKKCSCFRFDLTKDKNKQCEVVKQAGTPSRLGGGGKG
jgi:hypothetical protein